MTQHYVIAGRVDADGQLGGSFAWVAQTTDDAQRFIRATLETHGWTADSQVVILADGADGLSSLVQRATENSARTILDWFHISMRLRAIEQMIAKTAVLVEAANPTLPAMIQEKLPRVRHQMWNGRWANAISRMRSIFVTAGQIAMRPWCRWANCCAPCFCATTSSTKPFAGSSFACSTTAWPSMPRRRAI